jgi:hypothetical protein
LLNVKKNRREERRQRNPSSGEESRKAVTSKIRGKGEIPTTLGCLIYDDLFSMMCYCNAIYDGIMVMNKGNDVVE